MMKLNKQQKEILNNYIGHAADEMLKERIKKAHREIFKDDIFKGLNNCNY